MNQKDSMAVVWVEMLATGAEQWKGAGYRRGLECRQEAVWTEH